MILVDSSVWIAGWRGNDKSVVNRLTHLIESGQVILNPLIRTELLQGAKDRHHQQTLKNLLDPIPIESLPDQLWDESSALYLKVRAMGTTLTTIDCLIATHAIISSFSLWSFDHIFIKIPGLKLVKETD